MKKIAVLFCAAILLANLASAQKPSPSIPQATDTATAPATAMPTPVTAPATTTAEKPLALPAGTMVRIKLEAAISTSYNKRGDAFAGRVIAPVVFGGKTVVPVGASIVGRVIKVSEVRRYRGRPLIDLHPQAIVMPNGERYNISAAINAVSPETGASVNNEGEIHGSGMDRRDKVEMAAGTGAGAGVGALVGGGKGAFIGAAVGATATAVHWLSKTKSTELPAGTEITIELGRPVMLSMTVAGN